MSTTQAVSATTAGPVWPYSGTTAGAARPTLYISTQGHSTVVNLTGRSYNALCLQASGLSSQVLTTLSVTEMRMWMALQTLIQTIPSLASITSSHGAA